MSPHDVDPAPGRERPAVNHAGGIARLMGDGALFARVLGRFRNEYRQAAAGIRDALASGDTPLALRLVHTLKGAAGMIEAVPLRQEAHGLEQVLRGGDGDAWQRLARLEQALDRVLLELDMAAASTAVATAGMPIAETPAESDRDAGKEAAGRLATLLDDGNGDAVDLVREAAAALTAHLGEQRYRRLADAIEAFDFDGALALLKA